MAVVITQDLVISSQNGSSLPLNYARIGYQSYLDEGMLSLSAGTIVSGYPLDNVLTGQTFEVAKTQEIFMQIDIDLGQVQAIDYMAFVSKNVINYIFSYSDDGIIYTEISQQSDQSKVARMVLFDAISARYWRLFVSTSVGVEVQLTNLKLGIALAMYRPIYGGHSPVTLNRLTAKTPTRSEGGEFLSSSITRQGFAGSFDYRHLPANWYRDQFDPFVEHARTGTYYIAWNPEQFPTEVVYGWTEEDFSPSNMGISDLMQVSWNMRGYDAS